MRLVGYATIGLGLSLLLLADAALVFDLGALKPLYERVAGHYLQREMRLVGGSLAVITGGISILVRNVLNRLSTSGNVCADRLRKANEEMAQMDA